VEKFSANVLAEPPVGDRKLARLRESSKKLTRRRKNGEKLVKRRKSDSRKGKRGQPVGSTGIEARAKRSPRRALLTHKDLLRGRGLLRKAGRDAKQVGGFHKLSSERRLRIEAYPIVPAPSTRAHSASPVPPNPQVAPVLVPGHGLFLPFTKTASPHPVIMGQPLTLTITATNSTAGPNHVSFVDALPPTVAFEDLEFFESFLPTLVNLAICRVSIFSPLRGTVECFIRDIPAGESRGVWIIVTPTAPGNITSTAVLEALKPASATVTVFPASTPTQASGEAEATAVGTSARSGGF
jgi:uncharacterized repeat protein (TIGR01451 family)